MGVNILRHNVVGCVVRCGVLRRVLILLSAPFGIKTCEGGVDASAVDGIGICGFTRTNGNLVSAGSALVAVVRAAMRAVAHESLTMSTAGDHFIRVANVALPRGASFGLVWWLVRLGGKVVGVGG